MLSPAFILSIVSTVVSGAFAFVVMRRWWEMRRPHLFAWGVGLVMYTVGTLAQVVLALTWSPFFFALWYWCGALMVAPWLGQGTIYLLVRRGNVARNINVALILVGIMTFPWTLFLTHFNADAWYPGADMTTIYRDEVAPDGTVIHEGIMSGSARGTVRFFSPIMNIWGTVALVGGAIYSAWIFRRKNIMRNRVIGNWLIAAGGLLPALGGALIRLGDPSFQYVGTMLGAILIFMGYRLATSIPDDAPEPKRAATSGQAAGD